MRRVRFRRRQPIFHPLLEKHALKRTQLEVTSGRSSPRPSFPFTYYYRNTNNQFSFQSVNMVLCFLRCRILKYRRVAYYLAIFISGHLTHTRSNCCWEWGRVGVPHLFTLLITNTVVRNIPLFVWKSAVCWFEPLQTASLTAGGFLFFLFWAAYAVQTTSSWKLRPHPALLTNSTWKC